MNKRAKTTAFLIGLTTLSASFAGLISAEASTVTPHFDIKSKDYEITSTTPTHAIFLKCKASENSTYQSKGAILEVPEGLKDSKTDVALVTGHGLIAEADCFVSDFHGNSEKVLTKSFAKNYQSGTETDWAIISFKRLKGRHIKRYDIDNFVADTASLHNAPISFARARGLPQNSQNCKAAVFTLHTQNDSGPVFSHGCRAISGQSGSPVTQDIGGQHKLIGLHLGYMWTIKSPATGKPGKFNFWRPYDKDMSAEVKQVLSEMD